MSDDGDRRSYSIMPRLVFELMPPSLGQPLAFAWKRKSLKADGSAFSMASAKTNVGSASTLSFKLGSADHSAYKCR